MSKPTLLYASPFPPMKSGISDYSIVLVKALADKFDITLYTEDYEIAEDSINTFPVVKHGVDKIYFDSYDYILYNMGNNAEYHSYIYESALEHPGIIIQHDLILYHFIHEYYRVRKNSYYKKLYKEFGISEFVSIKEAVKHNQLGNNELASKLPLNEELLKSGNRFIVHSDYTRKKIIGTGFIKDSDILQVNMIQQIEDEGDVVEKGALFNKYKVPLDAIVVCAFGYIQSTKLNVETARAVKQINKINNKKICYVMVGQGDYADAELEENVVIKTGFTELAEFNSFIKYADIVVNLRNPSMGETSASVLRVLQMGKPCITNNGGWFSEIPDECVCKIELENVENDIIYTIKKILDDDYYKESISVNAQKYIESEFDRKKVTNNIYRFIAELKSE